MAPWKGEVRKLRVRRHKVHLLACLFGLVFTSLCFIAGDYLRIQWLRARSHVSLQSAFDQRNRLVEDNDELVRRIHTLRSEREGVLSLQEQMQKRLQELNSILSEASALGVLDETRGSLEIPEEGKEVGGLELPCDAECENQEEPEILSLKHGDYSGGQALFKVFDETLLLLKKLPLASPANGHINSKFGKRISPFSGHLRNHQGLDYSLPYGSPIYSSGDGVVEAVKRTSTYGLVIDIRHTDNIITRYAHLSHSGVEEGESICRGEKIGLVGSSGRSTGPHLHYEVRINGRAVNPEKLIRLGLRLVRVYSPL